MSNLVRSLFGGAVLSLGAWIVPSTPAVAVVYCTAAGAPAGCAMAPAVAQAAVHCTRPGYPVGCAPGAGAAGRGVARGVGVGAPGVGAAPMNRGGPVNRAGVR